MEKSPFSFGVKQNRWNILGSVYLTSYHREKVASKGSGEPLEGSDKGLCSEATMITLADVGRE